jgi:hypothetical protein
MICRHPEPLRDFDYVGMHYYSLTWCCDNREPLFTKADRVDLVRDQFLRAASEIEMAIVGFLRKDEEPRTVVRYIIENPLRAGLVQSAEDYPFTGSQIYSMKELMEWAYQY